LKCPPRVPDASFLAFSYDWNSPTGLYVVPKPAAICKQIGSNGFHERCI
jgi:hypothetical protein